MVVEVLIVGDGEQLILCFDLSVDSFGRLRGNMFGWFMLESLV